MKLIVKHDRNIQVRRCSAFSGTGNKMNYTLTRKEFHSILQWHAIPSGLKLSEKNDSFCSRTIGLDIQWHCAMPVWSPGKAKSTDMRGFPLTVSRHQAHQTSLGIFQKAITKSYSNLTSTQMSLNYLDSYFQKLV